MELSHVGHEERFFAAPLPPPSMAPAGHVCVYPVISCHGRGAHLEAVALDTTYPIQLQGRMTREAWFEIMNGVNGCLGGPEAQAASDERKVRRGVVHLVWTSFLTGGLSLLVWLPWHLKKLATIRRTRHEAVEAAREYLGRVNDVWEPAGMQMVLKQSHASGTNSSAEVSGATSYWLEVAWGAPRPRAALPVGALPFQ